MISSNDTTILSNRKSALGRNAFFLASVGASAAIFASAAYAQDANTHVETVTSSSSRIVNTGFTAPTPTTVLGAEFIENTAKDTIFETVTQLPSMLGSSGQQVGVNGTSGGTNGLAAFNMFGLGTNRTLTMLDGQRYVAANRDGTTDISGFPQMLVQRVDVVTGGASATWGSDAVAGVVNFITDKKFEGFKANISSGLSTYGDNASLTVGTAAGTSFAGGRGHFTISVDYSHQDGVGPGPKVTDASPRNKLANGRTWFVQPVLQSTAANFAATPAGQPQFYAAQGGQQFQWARTGLINSGPLQGIGFNPDGSTYQFNYGVGPNGLKAVPLRNGNASTAGGVTNCFNFCVGGDTAGQVGAGVTLVTPLTRGNVYARLSYDLTDKWNVWGTLSMGQVHTSNTANPAMWQQTLPGVGGGTGQNQTAALTGPVFSNSPFNLGQLLQPAGIQCGNAPGGANAFLPASINTACIANNITSFGFGSVFEGLGPNNIHTMRVNRRYALGLDGTFSAFGTEWSATAYATHGENSTRINVNGIALRPYMFAAIDSVRDANGAAVCRNVVARTMGCVPINPFSDEYTQSQKDWVYGGKNWGPGPIQRTKQSQDVVEFNISGSPFENWAGDVSFATGGGWRQEAYHVKGDGGGNGTKSGPGGATGSPCNDPLLNCANGSNWYAGSFHNAKGNFHVLEGFVEANIPLIDSTDWGTADLSVSGRHAKYSTAGSASTWKVGVTWDTPLDGVRFRALQSRDLRAPNLGELFGAPSTVNANVFDPWRGAQTQTVGGTYGNLLLKPEASINTQLGVVYTPAWLPGFNTSLDYYRIALKGAIGGSISGQQSITNCFNGQTSFCSNIIVAGGLSPAVSGNWLEVRTLIINSNDLVTDGFNWEATYQFSLEDWDVLPIPGNFTFRGMATYVSKLINRVPGTFALSTAGENNGAVPHMKAFFTQGYETDNWEIHMSEDWISEGKIQNSLIQCTPGSCPAPTAQFGTINDNHVPGYFKLNAGGAVTLNDHWKVFVQVDNLLNKSPPTLYTSAQNPNNAGANPLLYDVIGRMFTVGVRINN